MVYKRRVVLVDSNDQEIGTEELLAAHQGEGKLHRAISVVLYRKTNESRIEVLLQKRGRVKPLWPLYWSNTGCTHPYPDEDYLECAVRRLKEEMGIKIARSQLQVAYRFSYQVPFNDKLAEHELDTVIVGKIQNLKLKIQNDNSKFKINFNPDPSEVAEAKWMGWNELGREMETNGKEYTPWFRMIFQNGVMKETLNV